ncbi:MAG TPA: hypothetical protein VNV85_08500 [Puia sp.]|nr:hypothetical protein [Puia sp.]
MDSNFFAYLQRLEMMAFFSGYPLIYFVILYLSGNQQSKNNFRNNLSSLLPFAYALLGTLYMVLQLKNLYPDYSFENIKLRVHQPYLKIWGLLSILFWIPALGKKPVFSLLHSLVFFFFLVLDLFFQLFSSSADRNILRNDMKIYTGSLILNLIAFAMIVFASFLKAYYKKYLKL